MRASARSLQDAIPESSRARLVHEDPAIPSPRRQRGCARVVGSRQPGRPLSSAASQPTRQRSVHERGPHRQHSTCGASQFSRSSPLTWVPDQGANAAKATPAPTKKLHPTQPTDNTISKLWTGRPYDLPPWFLLNRRDLYDTVNGARQFVRFGITVDKKVSVRSLQHAQAYLNGTIIEGTLDVPFSIASLPPVAEFEQTESVTSTTAAPAQPPPGTVNTAGTGPRSLSAFQVVGRLGRRVEPRERDRRGAFRPLGEGAASLGRCRCFCALRLECRLSGGFCLLGGLVPAELCSAVGQHLFSRVGGDAEMLDVLSVGTAGDLHRLATLLREPFYNAVGAKPCLWDGCERHTLQQAANLRVRERREQRVPGPKVSDAAPRSRGRMGP
jgi:hypothetical protein